MPLNEKEFLDLVDDLLGFDMPHYQLQGEFRKLRETHEAGEVPVITNAVGTEVVPATPAPTPALGTPAGEPVPATDLETASIDEAVNSELTAPPASEFFTPADTVPGSASGT